MSFIAFIIEIIHDLCKNLKYSEFKIECERKPLHPPTIPLPRENYRLTGTLECASSKALCLCTHV